MTRLEELKAEASVYLEKIIKLNEEINTLMTEGWSLSDKAEFYVQHLEQSNLGIHEAVCFRSDLGSVVDALNPIDVDLLEGSFE